MNYMFLCKWTSLTQHSSGQIINGYYFNQTIITKQMFSTNINYTMCWTQIDRWCTGTFSKFKLRQALSPHIHILYHRWTIRPLPSAHHCLVYWFSGLIYIDKVAIRVFHNINAIGRRPHNMYYVLHTRKRFHLTHPPIEPWDRNMYATNL